MVEIRLIGLLTLWNLLLYEVV